MKLQTLENLWSFNSELSQNGFWELAVLLHLLLVSAKFFSIKLFINYSKSHLREWFLLYPWIYPCCRACKDMDMVYKSLSRNALAQCVGSAMNMLQYLPPPLIQSSLTAAANTTGCTMLLARTSSVNCSHLLLQFSTHSLSAAFWIRFHLGIFSLTGEADEFSIFHVWVMSSFKF